MSGDEAVGHRRYWVVLFAGTTGLFRTWSEALDHALRLAR